MKQRFHTVAYGHVQGVGFRAWVRQQAILLDLGGYCRNLPDGTVEVEAEGPLESVRELRRRLRRGPPAARVASLDDRPPSSAPLPRPFAILR